VVCLTNSRSPHVLNRAALAQGTPPRGRTDRPDSHHRPACSCVVLKRIERRIHLRSQSLGKVTDFHRIFAIPVLTRKSNGANLAVDSVVLFALFATVRTRQIA
jgi:hypothetical protein